MKVVGHANEFGSFRRCGMFDQHRGDREGSSQTFAECRLKRTGYVDLLAVGASNKRKCRSSQAAAFRSSSRRQSRASCHHHSQPTLPSTLSDIAPAALWSII